MIDFSSLDYGFLRDATFWTAAAAIIALLLGGVGPFFHDWVSRNWKRPKLSLLLKDVETVSDLYSGENHTVSWPIRVLVANRRNRKPAHDVEVFLEAIEGDCTDSNTQIPKYLPVRIPWAHSRESDSALEASTCSRIVGGGKQLLDLGTLEFKLTSMDGDLIEETCLTPHLLRFNIAANVGIDCKRHAELP